MAFCKNCGTKLEDGTKFCPKCGTSTEADDAEQMTRKQVFEGTIHKCPNCGAAVGAFDALCPQCGFELNEKKGSSIAKEFAEKLDAIESDREEGKASNVFSSMFSFGKVSKADNRKASFIKSFVVPNTKADLTEFLIMALENFDPSIAAKGLMLAGFKAGPGATADEIKNEKAIQSAWQIKIEQLYKKAKLSFGKDSSFSAIQEMYDEKMGLYNKYKKRNRIIILSILGAVVVFYVVLFVWLGASDSKSSSSQKNPQTVETSIESSVETSE